VRRAAKAEAADPPQHVAVTVAYRIEQLDGPLHDLSKLSLADQLGVLDPFDGLAERQLRTPDDDIPF
jgi:hypothetical protein